ncbi:MAG: conjugal transfer protein TraC, partial [Patescibacteria group bacterium]
MPFSPSTMEAKKPMKRGPTEAERLSAAKKKAAEETIVLEEERVYRTGTVSVRDIISPAAFKVDPSFVQIGSSFARTIFVVTYPRYISVGWSSPIINLNTAFDIGMFFYPVKSEIILKQLKKKVGALEAQISSDAEKGAPRDPIRETALRDIEQLRDVLTQGVEHFFQFAFY